MSSVTRFLTQVNPSASIFSAGNALASPATAAYEFVPASGNTVGNYPPGYVQLLPLSVSALITGLSGAVLRDMGKTIYAGVGATPTVYGRFRQVQVLVPSVGNNNFIGGSTGSNFGVIGGPGVGDVYTNYMTIYLPVFNNGFGAFVTGVTTLTTATVLAGTNQL